MPIYFQVVYAHDVMTDGFGFQFWLNAGMPRATQA